LQDIHRASDRFLGTSTLASLNQLQRRANGFNTTVWGESGAIRTPAGGVLRLGLRNKKALGRGCRGLGVFFASESRH